MGSVRFVRLLSPELMEALVLEPILFAVVFYVQNFVWESKLLRCIICERKDIG